jgi:hypothetical protein
LPGPRWADAGEVVLDCGWAVLSGADAARTAQAAAEFTRLPAPGAVRLVEYRGADGRRYLLAANFGAEPFSGTPEGASKLLDLASGVTGVEGIHLPAGEARLYQVV